ncbi:MAG: hypothetical protein M3237_04845 [Actinomycetota bacterium]|nr:hypothetical protein [Actinomycetota bacterium]
MEGHDAVPRNDAAERKPGRRRAQPPPTTAPAPPSARPNAEAPGRPDAHQASRDVIGALMADPPAASPAVEAGPEPAPDAPEGPTKPAPPPEPTPRPTPEPAAAPARRPYAAPEPGVSTAVRFPPKQGARRLMGAVVLIVLVATGGAAYLAYDDPTILTIGATASLGVLLLVVWAIRAGTPLTRMVVKGGQLEVRQGGLHLKFDLTSHYTPIRAQGTPGRRGWRVLFGRGTLPPFVVDSSMVDPRTFMEVLDSYRPE